MRTRALLLASVLVPLASGCTLWYLASDPLGGSEGGGDAATASDAGTSSDGPPDFSPDCGSLKASPNCGACGRACEEGATCVPTSGSIPFNCGATLVSFSQVPLAIATHDDRLYVLDGHGNVWTCGGACDSLDELVASGAVQTVGSISVSDEGAFWVVDKKGVLSIELDGGSLNPLVPDTAAVQVSAGGDRFAWTNGMTIRWQTAHNGPGFSFGSLNNPFADADTENVALVQDGEFVAWSTGQNQAHYTELFGDGGTKNRDFSTLTKSTNLTIAADNENVFLTWRDKTNGGEVDWLPNGAADFQTLDYISAAAKPAAVAAGNGRVYWSDTDDTITYCAPPACVPGGNLVLTLGIDTKEKVDAIAATSTEIFFINNGGLYRVSP